MELPVGAAVGLHPEISEAAIAKRRIVLKQLIEMSFGEAGWRTSDFDRTTFIAAETRTIHLPGRRIGGDPY
ncbi:MAG: hypothetical protein ACKVII_23035 [Planctomycetales bacterium]